MLRDGCHRLTGEGGAGDSSALGVNYDFKKQNKGRRGETMLVPHGAACGAGECGARFPECLLECSARAPTTAGVVKTDEVLL